MKKSILIFCINLPCLLLAQNDIISLSLATAKKTAIENKTKLKTDKIAEEVAHTQILEAMMHRYPQVNVGSDGRANVALQKSVIPAGVFGPNETLVRFGKVWNATTSADATYTFFDKKIDYDVHQAELNYELSKISQESDGDELIYNVVKSYANVLANKTRLAQQKATIMRLTADKKDVDTKVNNGILQSIESKRVDNQIAVTLGEIRKQEESIRISEEILKFNAGIDMSKKIVLTDSLPILQNEIAAYRPITAQSELKTLPYFRQQQLQIQLSENQIAKLTAKKYPTLSLYGYAGYQTQTNNVLYFVPLGDNFSADNKLANGDPNPDNKNRDAINNFPVAYLGVRMNWNLNPFWENKTLLSQNQLRIAQTESQVKEWEENTRMQIVQAQSALSRAQEDIKIQQTQVAFAEENLAFLRKRFQGDLITYKDIVDAENELDNAKINVILAEYNYLTAYYDLRKILGDL